MTPEITYCPVEGRYDTKSWRVVTGWSRDHKNEVFHGFVYCIAPAKFENSQHPGKLFKTRRAAGEDCLQLFQR